MQKRKKSDAGEVGNGWIVTYSDMVSLLLCFFVIMFNPDEMNPDQLSAIAAYFMAAGTSGFTRLPGKSINPGSTITPLPSMDRGKAMGDALRRAVSLFQTEVRANKVKVMSDERGIVISLMSDVFFNSASARINVKASQDILLRLGALLHSDDILSRKIRIEGHTDDTPVDPRGPWESNWQLSAMRSINVLQYLTDLGVDENRFQVAGFAHTVPVSRNDTAEGRAYNRHVDIIILDDAHL
jgi:chemotaxis protein MotB